MRLSRRNKILIATVALASAYVAWVWVTEPRIGRSEAWVLWGLGKPDFDSRMVGPDSEGPYWPDDTASWHGEGVYKLVWRRSHCLGLVYCVDLLYFRDGRVVAMDRYSR